MSYELLVSPRVLRDFDDIEAYLGKELKAPDAAKKLLGRLLAAMERLKDFPYEGEAVRFTYLPERGIRRVVVDRYLIFYRVEEPKRVYVLRILYGAADYINYLRFE